MKNFYPRCTHKSQIVFTIDVDHWRFTCFAKENIGRLETLQRFRYEHDAVEVYTVVKGAFTIELRTPIRIRPTNVGVYNSY